MPDRDQGWGHRGRHGQHDRRGPDNEHHRVEQDRPWERRAFGQEGRFGSDPERQGPGSRGRRWDVGELRRDADRGDARHDQDRMELDPEYLRWRDDQMRRHDRDYQDWRRSRQRQYDDDYRRSRNRSS